MLDRLIPNGTIGRCPDCGGDDIFEDGRFYCIADCSTSGSEDGEASGSDLPPSNR